MDARQARETLTALDYIRGDRRDTPPACLRCGSDKVFVEELRRWWHCENCGARITDEVMADDIDRRAREVASRGVGKGFIDMADRGLL